MTVPLLALFVPLAVGTVAAVAAFLVSLVEAGVSRTRVALWRLHDDIVDDLVADRFVDARAAVRLLDMVRRSILETKHLTVLRVFGTYLLYRLSADDAPVARNRLLRGETRDDLVNAHARRLMRVLSTGVYQTTVLGRLGKVGVPLAFLGVQVLRGKGVPGHRSSEEITETPVRTEVQLDYVLHPGTLPERRMAGVAC